MKKPDFKILGNRQIPHLELQKTAYAQGSRSLAHSHENARLVLVLRGKFSEVYAGRKRECGAFSTIFRPAREEHSEDYHGRGIVCLSVDLQPVWLERVNHYQVRLGDSSEFRGGALPALITKLAREFESADAASALAIEALILEIAVELARRGNEPDSPASVPSWLSGARDFIHAEYLQNPGIAEIANAAGVHPIHLARVFRRRYDITIADYIRRLRIEEAKRELASTDAPIADIALNTGFPDQSHFSKTFKRLTNTTPAAYRKLMRSR
ncbi:MAG TPA: helix-turn-helix transcriptional regulator [Pyrinomonadaceae bacterium]|jgi:AraC family transcriptional regulator